MQVLGHEVDGTYMLYEYNNCSGFSGSPGFNKQPALTFARATSRRWSCALWATASGWDSGREGGGVYREILTKEKVVTVIKASQLMCVYYFGQFIHTICLRSTLSSPCNIHVHMCSDKQPKQTP